MKLQLATALLLALAIPQMGCAHDRDDNPPGRAGGPGTNWENPPGPAGGAGASPDRRESGYWNKRYWQRRDGRWHAWNAEKSCWTPDFDGNPPGPAGGPGTNWENPPGPEGGPGASPDRWGSCR